MTLKEYTPHQVVLELKTRVTYVVDARTPEQAESIALDLVEDMDLAAGEVEGKPEVEVLEIFPVDEITSDEHFRSDSTGSF